MVELGSVFVALAENGLDSNGVDWRALGIALGLLVLALALLLAEIFVVSFGILLLSALAAGAMAVYYAFVAHDMVGWGFTFLAPVLAAMLLRFGFKRIRSSRSMVVQEEIGAEAGYHHLLDTLGIAIGSQGTMVTPARPSGRARFEGGECDVHVRGGSLEAGDRVTVRIIDGPMVIVSRGED